MTMRATYPMLREWFAARPGAATGELAAVTTTGVFCRAECAGRPKPANVRAYPDREAALRAGFRPCRRCRP